jgi:flagellin
MGLRVNTNVFSINAQRHLFNVSERLQGNYAHLASGLRIATAADDAAGLGVSERMRAQIHSFAAAERNAQDGVSLVQTAEGALAEVSANLVRMRELAIQSSNGTLNAGDRGVLDAEFTELVEEIDRIATDTEFNNIALLDGVTGTVTIQVGADSGDQLTIDLTDVTDGTLAIDAESVDTQTNAQASLAVIDAAITTVSDARGTFGAQQNRLESAVRSISNQRENLSAAESRIRDVDVAYETADLTRNSILQQAAASVLAQANTQPQLALSLLQ